MIFYNSSMPRAGSTLLQNILNQNSDIYATPTDGSLELLFGARVNYTNSAEFKAQDQDQMLKAWRGFCKEGLNGYVKGLSDKEHTCIKSRGIGIHYDWYSSFMGEDIKVICMVRDMKSILSSMEKMFRSNPEVTNSIQNHAEMKGTNTNKRIQDWLNGPPVGLALERLTQMGLEGISNKCLILRYEDLCTNPLETMEKVYSYLDIDKCEHDFNNVEQTTVEDDTVYGLNPNLHVIKKNVELAKPDYNEILGSNLCNWIDENCRDYQKSFGYVNPLELS